MIETTFFSPDDGLNNITSQRPFLYSLLVSIIWEDLQTNALDGVSMFLCKYLYIIILVITRFSYRSKASSQKFSVKIDNVDLLTPVTSSYMEWPQG